MRIFCVLRSGGDYGPRDVERLREGLAHHAPGRELHCLSDCGIGEPLRHGWPGWWSKMELFRPDVRGDVLHLDLDTAVVGDPADILEARGATMLSDFYRPERPASGVMMLPEASRAEVWSRWIRDPAGHMRRSPGGDQQFLATTALRRAARWQTILPGQIISYKTHLCERRLHRDARPVPPDARLVCFHGRPRPWEVTPEPWMTWFDRDRTARSETVRYGGEFRGIKEEAEARQEGRQAEAHEEGQVTT